MKSVKNDKQPIVPGCVVRIDGSPSLWLVDKWQPFGRGAQPRGTLTASTATIRGAKFWIGRLPGPAGAARIQRLIVLSDPREFAARSAWKDVKAGDRVLVAVRCTCADRVPEVLSGVIKSATHSLEGLTFSVALPDGSTRDRALCAGDPPDEGIRLLPPSADVHRDKLLASRQWTPVALSELADSLTSFAELLVERADGEILSGTMSSWQRAHHDSCLRVMLSAEIGGIDLPLREVGTRCWISLPAAPKPSLRSQLEQRCLALGLLDRHPLVTDAAARSFAKRVCDEGASCTDAATTAEVARIDRRTKLLAELSDSDLVELLLPAPSKG